MSYSRSSRRSSSYRYSEGLSDEPTGSSSLSSSMGTYSSFQDRKETRSPIRRSSRTTAYGDDETGPSTFRRTSRTTAALEDDDITTNVRRSYRSSRLDDDDSGLYSYQRTSRTRNEDDALSYIRHSSRLTSRDDKDDSSSFSRIYRSRYEDDDVSGSLRCSSGSSTIKDYDDIHSSSRRRSSRISDLNDDENGTITSSRIRSYRSSAPKDDDDDTLPSSLRRSSKTAALDKDNEDESLLYKRKSILSSYDVDDTSRMIVKKDSQTVISYDTGETDSETYLKTSRTSFSYSESYPTETKIVDVYVALLDYTPVECDPEAIPLKEGQEVEVIDSKKPHKWLVRSRPMKGAEVIHEGWVPSCYLEKKIGESFTKSETITEINPDPKEKETITRRQAVVKELVETEEDFARDMQYVVNNYLKEMDNPKMPLELRDYKDTVFSNFKDVCEFHNNVLIKGVQYYASEPQKLGITFLRLERDFDKHVKYCRDEPQAQAALSSGSLKNYFDDFSRKIGDDKTLAEHLKLPIQRINDYVLLIKELIKYTNRLREDTTDLQRALDFMMCVPQRATDLTYINALEGYCGNVHKLGRLIKHDWFEAVELSGLVRERYVFLFKGRMFITEVIRVGLDRQKYLVKNILKLQDIEIVDQVDGEDRALQLIPKTPEQKGLPVKLIAKSVEQKQEWSEALNVTAVPHAIEDLGDEEPVLVIQEPQKTVETEQKIKRSTTQPKHEAEPERKAAKLDEEKPNLKKQTETDAKVEILEDFDAYEEINTVMTESLHSGSITSLDASEMEPSQTKPQFKKSLRGVVCGQGESAVFECEVKSQSSPTIKWLKNNQPINPTNRLETMSLGSKYSLIIKDTTQNDAGLYTVMVTNSQGVSSCSAPLNVRPGSGLEAKKGDSRPTSPGGTVLPHEPVFKVKLKDTELLEGTCVRFELVVRGHPVPEVTFYKNGQELNQDDRVRVVFESKEVFELIIDHVASEDVGLYSCVAVNSEGRTETTGHISITKDKVLFQGLEDELLGSKTPSPEPGKQPAFKWFRDGKDFEISDRFKVSFNNEEDTLALVFQHVTPDDAGLYTCVASTSGGKISCSAELTVQGVVHKLLKDPEPPTIKASLTDVDVSEGGSAMLEMKATGYPVPKITWFCGSEEITAGERYRFLFEDEESYALIIKNVTKKDAGTYSVVAKNDIGEVNTSCQLTVTCPPCFRKQMKDKIVMTDETVTFEVEAEGKPTPEIKWYKDGQLIVEDERIKLIHKDEEVYALVIEKAKSEDSGSYSCHIKNESGSQSGFGTLTVNAPPMFIRKMKCIESEEDEAVTFNVKISGNPKPKAKWLKDGVEIKADDKHWKVEEDGNSYTLIIDRVKKEDAGNYTCNITNEYGSLSGSGSLTVKRKPNFKERLTDIEAVEGDTNVELHVKAEGTPQPKIIWYFENMEITENENYKITADEEKGIYKLILKKVTSQLSGKYSCEAVNSIGKTQTSGIISVNAHPKFVQGLKDVEGIEEKEVLLTVKVAGEPKPKITWIKDGTELTIDGKCRKVKEDVSDSFTLVLNRVTKEDVGEYRCRITNKCGEESTSCKLTVKAKPKFIRQLSDKESKEGDVDVEFTCQLDSDPIPKIKWMFNDKEVVDCEKYNIVCDEASGTYTLKVKKASAETEGVYSCEASNKIGKVRSCGVLSVNAPPVFIQKLGDVQINEGETVSFTVKVMGKPKPSLKWFQNDTEVTIDGEHYKTKEEASDTFTLIINKCTRNDIGQFSCEASNTCGKVTTCGKLSIKSKPIFRKKLVDMEAREGDTNVQFVVEVEGIPKPTLIWFIDELDITSSENYKTIADDQTGIYKLIARKVSTDLAGKYTCEAANSCGKTDSTAIFNVLSKPKVLKGLKDIDVLEEENVHLTVKISGSPTPNIKWTKDGEQVNVEEGIKIEEKEANTYILEIKKVTISCSGEYTCRGSNKLGEVSTTAKVNVLSKPKFVKGMEDKEVWTGEESYFEVKVLGHPEPTVKWLKEGEELKASDYITLTSEHETYKINIQNTRLEDSGVYSCHVKNMAGECCQDAMLSVKSADDSEEPVFIRRMVDTFAVIGDAARFEVKVTGKPKPEVSWFKDGEQLSADERIKISSDVEDNYYILTINNLALEDSGKYSCTAFSDKGSASDKATMTVMEPVAPKIDGMDNIEVKKGMVAKFEVKTSGYPVPDIKWLKAGIPVQFSDHIMITSDDEKRLYTLSVQSVMEEDVAVYTCVASNSAGKISKDAKISLKAEPPSFLKDMVDIESEEGGEVGFEVCVSGYPQPEVVWCRNMTVLTAADSHVNILQKNNMYGLNILKVTEEDIATYSCTAKNIAGEAKSTAVLRFQEQPPVVKQALPQKMFVMEGEKVNLEGKVVGYPPPDITWTKDGEPIQPSNKFKMEQTPNGIVRLAIEDAKPGDSGNYAIVANNNKGEISSESNVSVESKDKFKPEILQHMLPAEVTAGQPAKLKAQFCGQPKPLIKWLKNGEEVSSDDHIKLSEDDDGNVQLIIDSSIPEDTGKYAVFAVNEAGDVSTVAKLTVKNPSVHKPEIKDGLKATEFIEDHPGCLEIQISAEPKAKVKWTKDGQELVPSEHFTIVEEPDGIVALIIDKVTPQDAGKYAVIIYNDEGTAESEARVTTVQIGENPLQAPKCVHRLHPTQLVEGEPGKLETKVLGVPKPDISWLKDGEEIQPSNHVKMIEKPDGTVALLLEKVTPEDAGKYTFVARNDKGEVRDDADVSTVPPSTKDEKPLAKKPEFEHQIRPTLLTEEKPGKLEVVVSGEPKPEVQWFKDGKVIHPSNHVEMVEKPDGTVQLLLDKVTLEDAGKYCVVARNDKGEITNEADVTTVPPSRKIEKPVAKKPEFEHRLRPALLTEEEPGKLEAIISGAPKVKVQWLKDGKTITPNDHFTPIEKPDGTVALLIDKVTPEDAGRFGVVVTSDEGEIKSEANVTTVPKIMEEPIGKRPEFVRTLSPVELEEGNSLKLEAKVIGDPAPTITWFKDNQEVLSSERIIMLEEPDGTVSLLIENMTPEDAGKYAVVASNPVGKSRSFAFVDVTALPKKEPEFLDGLKPVNLPEGQSGRLEVLIKSDTKPEIKWLKNGQEIKPDDQIHIEHKPDGTQALVLDKVKPEDTGIYSILAANHHGESRSSAPLTVNQQPFFKKTLQDVEAVEDFPAKLEVQVFGVPQPEVKWFKDGRELNPDKDNVKMSQLSDGVMSLIISSCHPEDSGKYSCIAKNPLGESSSDGSLTVKGKEKIEEPQTAPVFLTSFRDVSVKEGEIISFEAEVGGNPLPEIKWYLNDLPVTESDNISKMFDGKKAVLEIRRCKPQHSGVYECQLTNSLGEARLKGKADIAAHIPPRFIQRLYNTNISVSEPLNLTCRVKGDPEPQIEWYFKGSLIESGLKYNMEKHGALCQLTILKPHINDSGLYECRAKNAVGSDSCNAEVKVSDKVEKGEAPKFLKKIGDCEVCEGATAKFTACIVGTPQPDVKWIKDGELIEPSARYKMEAEPSGVLRLIIHNVHPTDVGNYNLVISNSLGNESCTAHMRLESLDDKLPQRSVGEQYPGYDKFRKTGAPVPLPDKPRILRMTDHNLTLAWKPSLPASPRVPVTYGIEMSKYPDGEWKPYKSGIKDSSCDIRGLVPCQDYRFRIRVENKYGTSDSSPYVTAHRSKLEPLIPADFKPKDFKIEHPPLEKYAAPPKFLRKEEEIMYGIRGHPVTIEFWIYGYPEPKITWYFNNQKIEFPGSKYDSLQDRNGQICLFLNKMTEADEGTFMCHAVNEHGDTRQKIRLLLAEPPSFYKRLNETTIMLRRSGRLECQVTGIPYPAVRWFKDWHPLYESSRIKIFTEEPDKCVMYLSGSILKDSGLYSVTVSNIAGSASCSATLSVEETEADYDILTYSHPHIVKPKIKPFEDYYDIGDELGRGTQGIVYHSVERVSGKSYAAKMMHGKGKLRDFMDTELDIMNQLCHPRLVRLFDAFETKSSLTLVTDLCGGGELLDNILKHGKLTEKEVAHYIRQVLEGLEHMHSKNIAHLGLTIGDILVTRVNGDIIKIGDFGLAQHLHREKENFLDYGHPEFVAPEIVNKEPATLAADIWSVGVITYLLLSGISPFLGENDRETLKRVQTGKITFFEDAFAAVSDDARDFISRLLVFSPSGRIDVKTALEHPWLKFADTIHREGQPLSVIDRLHEYYKKWKSWYANASCKRFYRRRPLESCYTHPSKMIYPPDELYTPPSSPEPELNRTPVKPAVFDDTFQQKISREPIDVRSESHYQNGPDTYLLQYRDTDFPLRVRQYLRVGAHHSPSLAASLKESHWGDTNVAVRERRRFLDVWDEEMDDEKKGVATRTKPMRLHHELSSLGYAHEQLETLKNEAWKDKGKTRETLIGMEPYFREKIKDVVIQENDEIVFSCYAIGDPAPSYTWFRNDGILIESGRIMSKKMPDGRCELHLKPGKAYDVGVYKCIARNLLGSVTCRARLKIGGVPGRPDAPDVEQSSDTEILLVWCPPKNEGNSPTLCYCLEYKQPDESTWTKVSDKIDHEFYVVRDLSSSTIYHFRMAAKNRFGWSESSLPSEQTSTLASGAPKVKITKARKYRQEMTERGHEIEMNEFDVSDLDYNIEQNPIPMIDRDPMEMYNFVAEIARGRFSVVVKIWVKEMGKTLVGKVIHTSSENESDVLQEYDILKSLRHERIASLEAASRKNELTILVMEKLSGIDILTYLTSHHEYSEDTVAKIITQVLNAIEYLHFRGICCLEIQPDNVVMINHRRPDIKLVDLGSASYVPKTGKKIDVKGKVEYLAPEIVKKEEVSTATDVWAVGVLTYILLSGVSPFRGETDEQTEDNIEFIRYQFENLHAEVTQEVTRFLMYLFKRTPKKRATVQECLENKWLLPSEFIMKKRENAIFLSHRLHEFSESFHNEKQSSTPQKLLNMFGMSFSRSVSLEMDTYDEF